MSPEGCTSVITPWFRQTLSEWVILALPSTGTTAPFCPVYSPLTAHIPSSKRKVCFILKDASSHLFYSPSPAPSGREGLTTTPLYSFTVTIPGFAPFGFFTFRASAYMTSTLDEPLDLL